MKKILSIAAVSALFLSINGSSALADVSVWSDPATKVSVSYADTWRAGHNQKPGDVLTINAPSGAAQCVVNIVDEGRFKIYPVALNGAIQRTSVSSAYWDGYLARYNDVVVHEGSDNHGLGDGFASMVRASYSVPGVEDVRKKVLGFASYDQGQIYTVECSARESAYLQWEAAFLNVVKSVNFYERTNFALNGYYRNFIADKTLKVRGPRASEDTYLGIHTR